MNVLVICLLLTAFVVWVMVTVSLWLCPLQPHGLCTSDCDREWHLNHREFAFTLSVVPVVAKPRKLRTTWSREAIADLSLMWRNEGATVTYANSTPVKFYIIPKQNQPLRRTPKLRELIHPVVGYPNAFVRDVEEAKKHHEWIDGCVTAKYALVGGARRAT